MALRAFHANPFIGGFGSESSSSRRNAVASSSSSSTVVEDGDAVCQIIKELVDNAVDACQSMPQNYHLKTPLRVKVELQPMTTKNNWKDNDDDNSILKVTVCDNGCGMSDISKCVDAFQSTKNASNSTNTNQNHAAGRYGIGLTLSLLHAQRLVPHSVACITSTTRRSQRISRRLLKVNVAQDQIEFVQQTNGSHLQESIPKPTATDSGTCVSLLVPVSKKEKEKKTSTPLKSEKVSLET